MKFKYLIIIYICFYFLKIFADFYNGKNSLIVHALDIGQGDAILITTPNKKHILIDGGPDFEVDNLVYKHTFPHCYLDIVIMTHPHKDHIQGINRLLEHCKTGTIFFNNIPYASVENDRFLNLTQNLNTKPLYAGQMFTLDSINFYVLWPEKSFITKPLSNINLASIVLLMDKGNIEALFMGDLENPIISNLSNSPVLDQIDAPLEFYKVAHHGSDNGLNASFIKKLNPQISVVSAGEGNSYKHPHKQVIEFFTSIKTKLYRTDKDGTVTINLNNLPK